MIFNSVPLSVNDSCFWYWQLCFTQCQWCLLVLVMAMPHSVNSFMLMTVCVDDGCVPLSVHGICVHGFAPLTIDILCQMTPLRYGPQKSEGCRVRLTVSLRPCLWPCGQAGSQAPAASWWGSWTIRHREGVEANFESCKCASWRSWCRGCLHGQVCSSCYLAPQREHREAEQAGKCWQVGNHRERGGISSQASEIPVRHHWWFYEPWEVGKDDERDASLQTAWIAWQ